MNKDDLNFELSHEDSPDRFSRTFVAKVDVPIMEAARERQLDSVAKYVQEKLLDKLLEAVVNDMQNEVIKKIDLDTVARLATARASTMIAQTLMQEPEDETGS